MTAKHTPGPFFVTESSDWGGMSGVSLGIDDAFGMDGGRDYHLATVVHGDPDELQANARLMAAAPELLEAAKLVLEWYEAEDNHSGTDFHQRMQMCRDSEDAIRAAIAKATGATP